MVGESGGTYYATPAQLATFNGERAYKNYAGRNEALAMDVFDNLTRMARPRLVYYSASETAWFGIEHLNIGYHDFTRLPNERDGVFFTQPFQEGRPGIQPERLPPYVTTLNPGWDPALPLYKPLAMFDAQKAALADNPQPGLWSRRAENKPPVPTTAAPTLEQVGFLGNHNSALFRRLEALGVPFTNTAAAPGLLLVAGDGLETATLETAKVSVNAWLDRGGVVLLMLGQESTNTEFVNHLLPAPVQLTTRRATALERAREHPWMAGLNLPDLYFAEESADRHILKHGLAGPLVEQSQVLLQASDTDWSLFNHRPETVKCAAVVLYEQLVKPGGAALIVHPQGPGKLALCSLDWRISSRATDALWRKLFANLSVKLRLPRSVGLAAFDEKGTLINALSLGRFGGPDLETALTKDFLGDASTRPKKDAPAGGLTWKPVTCPSRDRFVFNQLGQTGPQTNYTVYFSYWIKSPRALDDLLSGGPDAPQLTTFCYVADQCSMWVNGQALPPVHSEPADYRTRLTFAGLPLKKGWNHILIKVAARQLHGDHPGTLAVRITSNHREYLQELESADAPEEAQK